MEKRMYLPNGEEVNLVEKVKSGYLYSPILEDWSGAEYVDEENILFSKELLENPPMAKKHKEIERLDETISKSKAKINELADRIRGQKSLLKHIKEEPFLKMLSDYLNDNYEYVLRLKTLSAFETLSIAKRGDRYNSPYISINKTERHDFHIQVSRNNMYFDSDDERILIFKSFEDTQKEAKNRLIKELMHNTEEGHSFRWGSDRIKQWHSCIHRSTKLSDDKDVVFIYNEKLVEAKQREEAEKQAKLQKEIEEAKAKLDKLQNK